MSVSALMPLSAARARLCRAAATTLACGAAPGLELALARHPSPSASAATANAAAASARSASVGHHSRCMSLSASSSSSSSSSSTHKFLGKGSPFVDFKRIKVCAGNGGDGAIAFFKGIHHPMGPPSGGNGGRGGNVFIRASKTVTSLNGVLNQYMAPNGNAGMGKQMHGADGEDVEIVVPVGTLVRELRLDDSKDKLELEEQARTDKREQDAARARRHTHASPPPASSSGSASGSASAPEPLSESPLGAHNDAEGPRDAAQTEGSRLDADEMHELELAEYEEEEAHRLALARLEAEDDETEPGDPRLALVQQHFRFRSKYLPQNDRIKMLMERIPQRIAVKPPMHFDLLQDGERRLVARGGRAGLGNPHFASPTIPGPGIAGRGEKVSPIVLELELKTMADAGLVGLPNAGKSTLLKATSNAHPKIAPYPFTTLNPYVGTIDFEDYWTMTIADIPGIIAGAHANLGLGHRFLRHIERTKLLVYVIDLAGEAPWSDLEILQGELEAFQEGLTDRPSLIAANKADVAGISQQNFEILKTRTRIPIVPISAKHEKNVRALTTIMRKMVEQIQQESATAASAPPAKKAASPVPAPASSSEAGEAKPDTQ
ncbi:hypothetical protein BC831DRAFT_447748, partial [Entophlyctis helioformis]